MAISRVNTTTSDITGQPFGNIGIPSTTAGNTIIVCLADGFYQSPSVPSVSDNAGNTYTLQTSAFTGSVGNPARRNARIWTAINANGGATNISVFWGIATNARVHVLEYSGIKTTGAVENVYAYNNFPSGVLTGSVEWTTAYSLLLSINANNSTNAEAINAVDAPVPPWTLVSSNRATYGGSLTEKIPTYASPSTFETQGLTGNASAQCWTSIVILKADLSVLCNETIDTDDVETNDSFIAMAMDMIGLSDLVDALLNGNERFKSIVETLVLNDTIAFLNVYNRLFQETILPLDTLTFVNQYVRILEMETIRVKDWLGVKKTNSTNWGS